MIALLRCEARNPQQLQVGFSALNRKGRRRQGWGSAGEGDLRNCRGRWEGGVLFGARAEGGLARV